MFERIKTALRGFMVGRNGVDTLAWVFCLAGLLLSILGNFEGLELLGLLSNVLLILALFRIFSRNIPKRQAENQKLTQFLARIKSRKTHCYFRCPSCKTQVRVPKGKGKIKITCPSCRETFVKKT